MTPRSLQRPMRLLLRGCWPSHAHAIHALPVLAVEGVGGEDGVLPAVVRRWWQRRRRLDANVRMRGGGGEVVGMGVHARLARASHLLLVLERAGEVCEGVVVDEGAVDCRCDG